MKKGVLAIFDSNTEYAMHLMDYINRKKDFLLEACVFTNGESLTEYTKESTVDILLIGEDCNLVGMCKEHIRHMIVLSEGKYVREDMAMPVVYKFQSIEQMLKEILAVLLDDKEQEGGYVRIGKKASCIGFFSASGGSHKTSIALAAGQMLAKKAETLYLNFELLPSIEPQGINKEDIYIQASKGMSELLYYVRQGNENISLKVKTMAEDIGGLACICPVSHYRDLYDMEPEDVDKLFGDLKRSNLYEKILVDVGFLGDAAWALLEHCEKIIVPQGFGSIGNTKMKGLLAMLKAEGREELCERFIPIQSLYDEKVEQGLYELQNLTQSSLHTAAETVIQRL